MSTDYRSDTRADGPQTVYCPDFPRCHVSIKRHGREEEQKQTKIATGTFPPGTTFRVKCWRCKGWALVEF